MYTERSGYMLYCTSKLILSVTVSMSCACSEIHNGKMLGGGGGGGGLDYNL